MFTGPVAMTVAALARSEARALRALVESFQRTVDPGVGCRSLGPGVLVAMGPGRYVNRGVGVGPDLTVAEIDEVVRFYAEVGLPAMVQLSSEASEETLARLTGAGFAPIWFRSVHACPIEAADGDVTAAGHLRLVVVDELNLERWIDVLAIGNGIVAGEARARSDEYALVAHGAVGATDFLAFDGDRAIGCGSIQREGETAWFGGAATVPSERGRGVQLELLRHRLRIAADLGCSVAAATASSGGVSARNLGRAGLERIDVQLVLGNLEGRGTPS